MNQSFIVTVNKPITTMEVKMCSIVKNIISTDKDTHFTEELLQYQDYNETNKLYISLMNTSNTPKLGGSNGEIQINIKINPRL